MSAMATKTADDVVNKRRTWLDKWMKRAKEIEANPDPSWNIEDKSMRRILSGKRLQLLREIIQEEGYGDVTLARDIQHGFDLVGRTPESNVLPGKLSPATLTAADLEACAPKVQQALKRSLGSSGDSDLDEALWQKTLDEVSAGWLESPFGWDTLGHHGVPSRRFPLRKTAR